MATDYTNGFMAASYGVSAVADIGSAYAQSEALRAQGEFQRSMVEINNKFAAVAAKDALKAGEEKTQLVRKKARATIGAQRAAAAAQGIDVSDGSVLDQIYDTQSASEDEILTLRNNAWREAFGFTTQAKINSREADFKQHAANVAANQTLLTGGLQAAGNIARAGSYAAKQYGDGKTPAKSSKAGNDDPYFGSAPRGEYSVSGRDPKWWPAEEDNSFSGWWSKSFDAKSKGGTP